ncbi:MAG: class I SAM-dependent methyltransferase [Gammaproteobacteria bacterium]|nr:class I SAM-dependent methyltransferase [Gammaproteobacteria bacterium]
MSENLAVRAHRRLVMNRRVRRLATHVADLLPDDARQVLDVGAGTGELAVAVSQLLPGVDFTGVDVYIRPHTFIPVTAYDGRTLPFDNDSFDAVTIVDVLHHCDDPVAVLAECARVARRWVVIKDHVADSRWQAQVLRFMDWVGNRAHGVVLPYNYLSSGDWQTAMTRSGLQQRRRIVRLGLYPQPFSLLFDADLHFAGQFEKTAG